MTRPEDNGAWISEAFDTVIDYIISDNESDMNPETLALIEILQDLQGKVRYEEEEVNNG